MAQLPRSRTQALSDRAAGRGARLDIRRAIASDAIGVEALWLELLEHHAALHPAFALRTRDPAPFSAAIRARLADPTTALWVAAGPGGPVEGFCVAEIETGAGALCEARRGVITELAVSPVQRRLGIATRLVEAALSWFRCEAVARVEVRVLAGNRNAQSFWRAQGFGAFVDVLERRL